MDYKNKKTYVYLIRIKRDGNTFYKVGISNNVKSRLSRLIKNMGVNVSLRVQSRARKRYEALYIEGYILSLVAHLIIKEKILSSGNSEIFECPDDSLYEEIIKIIKYGKVSLSY